MAVDETTQSAARRDPAQAAGGGRTDRGDERRTDGFVRVTSGWLTGTSGERKVLWRTWLFVAAISVLILTVNALTVIDDQPTTPTWQPWVWEISSAIVIVAVFWLPWLFWRAARRHQGVVHIRFWLIHAAGAVTFSVVHIAGFLVLRHLAYAAVGETYEYGSGWWGEFPYELRKDVISYGLFVSAMWVTDRLMGPGTTVEPETPATYDIRDGQRVIRAPLEDILAVTSAGNYVEFVLADGRRPLMRAALSAVEAELAGRGFVRTHRSWLVNGSRVTGLRPEGSGDWTVELGEVEAPLSRRFPEALKQLRRD